MKRRRLKKRRGGGSATLSRSGSRAISARLLGHGPDTRLGQWRNVSPLLPREPGFHALDLGDETLREVHEDIVVDEDELEGRATLTIV